MYGLTALQDLTNLPIEQDLQTVNSSGDASSEALPSDMTLLSKEIEKER